MKSKNKEKIDSKSRVDYSNLKIKKLSKKVSLFIFCL